MYVNVFSGFVKHFILPVTSSRYFLRIAAISRGGSCDRHVSIQLAEVGCGMGLEIGRILGIIMGNGPREIVGFGVCTRQGVYIYSAGLYHVLGGAVHVLGKAGAVHVLGKAVHVLGGLYVYSAGLYM